MPQAKIFEGTWQELTSHAEEFQDFPTLSLYVSIENTTPLTSNDTILSPQQRIKILDELADRNRHIPAPTAEAYNRENLYSDNYS